MSGTWKLQVSDDGQPVIESRDRDLVAMVLTAHIRGYVQTLSRPESREHAEAKAFIFGPQDMTVFSSFDVLCLEIDLDPNAVREQLRKNDSFDALFSRQGLMRKVGNPGEPRGPYKKRQREPEPCVRCGQAKKLVGRGMCSACYHREYRKGRLERWLSYNERKEALEVK